MSSFNPTNPGPSQSSDARIAEETAKKRESYITNKQGDAVGNNWTVAKSDFSTFLGYKPATAGELSGKTEVTGHRVLEVALQKEFQKLGEGAAANGNSYRNMFVSQGKFANQPGREGDAIKDGVDAIRQGPDRNSTAAAEQGSNRAVSLGGHKGVLASGLDQYLGKMGAGTPQVSPGQANMLNQMGKGAQQTKNDNIRYLEMQYKFQEISKQESTISNLMKTRHDAVSRVIRGGQ